MKQLGQLLENIVGKLTLKTETATNSHNNNSNNTHIYNDNRTINIFGKQPKMLKDSKKPSLKN